MMKANKIAHSHYDCIHTTANRFSAKLKFHDPNDVSFNAYERGNIVQEIEDGQMRAEV